MSHLVKIITINGNGRFYRPVCNCGKWEGSTTESKESARREAAGHGVLAVAS